MLQRLQKRPQRPVGARSGRVVGPDPSARPAVPERPLNAETAREQAALESYLADLEARAVTEEEAANRSRSVETIIRRYRENFDAATLDRAAIIAELVEGVSVETWREGDEKRQTLRVIYRFAEPNPEFEEWKSTGCRTARPVRRPRST